MLGIVYLILACFVGYNLFIKKLLPGLFNVSKSVSLFGRSVSLDNRMVTYPASFLVGTLVMTWITYLCAYAFRFTSAPLFYGNVVSMILFAVAAVYVVFSEKGKYAGMLKNIGKLNGVRLDDAYTRHQVEILFVLIAFAVSSFLMFYTFNIKNGNIYIGASVFSDFGPHLSVIRSFSQGANFPTQYPHFADGTIRYHFLFQFLAGNLEFLGLPLDWAFNVPSILALVAFLMLLYSFAVMAMGKPWIGVVTSVLFFFRSSFAFFTFLGDMKNMSIGQIIQRILRNDVHIGKTLHEEWGLWAQNVYVNQRHFAFSLGIFLLILIVMFPLFKRMIVALRKVDARVLDEIDGMALNASRAEVATTGGVELQEGVQAETLEGAKARKLEEIKKQSYSSLYRKYWMEEFLLKSDAWVPKDFKRSVVVGLILGLISFWNGAVVFAALPVLFVIALLSKHRLEFLCIATITVLLSILETGFFIPGGSAVKPMITIGFLSESRNIAVILKYYIQLLGILPFVVIGGLVFAPKGARWLALAFFMPIVVATTIQLTPDIAVNHKYVIISVILLNIVAAGLLYRLYTAKMAFLKAVAVVILITMTITGVVDFITLYNMNNNNKSIVMSTKDPLMLWVEKNTKPNEIFLTDAYCLHPILLAGREIFYGWPYFTWSAGYDTDARGAVVNEIYGATDESTLKALVKKNNISYIVIEDSVRHSETIKLNEELIKKSFRSVYQADAGATAIYRTY